MINYKKPIIVLAGCTASGKSSLALKIAEKFNGYIINADSRQVYRELKIGTAQPTPEIVQNDLWYIEGIKHYLYGQIPVKNSYNLFQYQQDAQKVLDKEKILPILVGGTGLYIDCVVHNYDLKKSDITKRKKLESMSVKQLQSMIDTEVLEKMNNSDINNPIRLIRAIERGDVDSKKGETLKYLYLLLDIDQDKQEEKIKNRVDQMFKDGLLEENEQLLEAGFDYNNRPLQTIGYQEFEGYFNGRKSLEDVKNDIVLHTIQYAKRQRTWFRRNKDVVKIKNYEDAYDTISNFLTIS